MKDTLAHIGICLTLMSLTSCSMGQKENSKETVMHSYLCSDIGAKRVFKVSAAGEIQWE